MINDAHFSSTWRTERVTLLAPVSISLKERPSSCRVISHRGHFCHGPTPATRSSTVISSQTGESWSAKWATPVFYLAPYWQFVADSPEASTAAVEASAALSITRDSLLSTGLKARRRSLSSLHPFISFTAYCMAVLLLRTYTDIRHTAT